MKVDKKYYEAFKEELERIIQANSLKLVQSYKEKVKYTKSKDTAFRFYIFWGLNANLRKRNPKLIDELFGEHYKGDHLETMMKKIFREVGLS